MTASILATVPAPDSYGWCFLLTFVCLALSFGALVVVREPAAGSSAPAVPLRSISRGIPAPRPRSELAWYLTARAFGVLGSIGSGFYTVRATAWTRRPRKVGVFTTPFVGQMAGNTLLGWLADRQASPGDHPRPGRHARRQPDGIAAPTPRRVRRGLRDDGIQIAAMNVSNLSVMLEFAPSEQPTYVGLGTTLVAPIAFGAPLVAGLLADALGFLAVFVVAAIAVSVALGLLIARVRDPRAMIAPRVA